LDLEKWCGYYLTVGHFLLIYYVTDLICMMVEEFNTGFFDMVVQLEEHVLYSFGAQMSKKLQLVSTLLWSYVLVYQVATAEN
jgi:hypothetical protein